MRIRNLTLRLDNEKTMNCAVFGNGTRALLLLPGLSDGLHTVKGLAFFMALSYWKLARNRMVYMFSRANEMKEGTTIRDMSEDLFLAMKKLGIAHADAAGFSQGGMIAQQLAIDHPECVDRLILAVTSPRAEEKTRTAVNRWIEYAEQGDFKNLMLDTARLSYTEAYARRMEKALPLLLGFLRPKSLDRFLIQARSILSFDAGKEVSSISCPTLIIGAGQDQIIPKEGVEELHRAIPGSKVYIYEDLGHGFHEETSDWQERMCEFLK